MESSTITSMKMWFILSWTENANNLSLHDEEICWRENQWDFWEMEWKHMTSLKGRQQTLCISQSHNYFTFSSVGMFLSLGAGPGLVLLSLGFGAENLCRKMNCKGWKWCFCYILAAHMPSSASLHGHQLNILQHMGILAARGAFQNPETSGFRAY